LTETAEGKDKKGNNYSNDKVTINRKTLILSLVIVISISAIMLSSGPISLMSSMSLRAAAPPSSSHSLSPSTRSSGSSPSTTSPTSLGTNSAPPSSSSHSSLSPSSSSNTVAPGSSAQNPLGGPPGKTGSNPGQSGGTSPPPGQGLAPKPKPPPPGPVPPGQCAKRGPAFKMCHGECVDTSENGNCGDCDVICPNIPGEICALNFGPGTLYSCQNVCEDPKKPDFCIGSSGQTVCTNKQTDDFNCGKCGRDCTKLFPGSVCQNGDCKCPEGYTDTCGPQPTGPGCVNLNNDPNNCKTCGHGCQSNEECQNGECVQICENGECACLAGQHWDTSFNKCVPDCTGQLTNVPPDGHCGCGFTPSGPGLQCGNQCCTSPFQVCDNGVCKAAGCTLQQPSGQAGTQKTNAAKGTPTVSASASTTGIVCGDQCADPSDPKYCNSCAPCASGQICQADSSSSTGFSCQQCASGQEPFNNQCVPVCPIGSTRDPTTGQCSQVCPPGQEFASADNACCAVSPGNVQVCNGHCTEISSNDNTNCGACGNTCHPDAGATASACINGACLCAPGTGEVLNQDNLCVCPDGNPNAPPYHCGGTCFSTCE
jgi:hypothetical protein